MVTWKINKKTRSGKSVMTFKRNEVKKLKKTVKHLVALEKGATIYDEFPTNAVLASAGTVLYLNPALTTRFVDEPQIVAGEKSIKAFYKSLSFTMRPYYVGLSATNSVVPMDAVVRVIIFQDWANKGALPAVTDVLVAATPDSPHNRLNSKRFSIKHDKLVVLKMATLMPTQVTAGNTGIWQYTGIQHVYRHTIKLAKNKPIEYIGTAGTVADAQRGQLFMLTLQDAASITANQGVADYFYDSQLTCEFI